jgi:hypothetical protein
MHTGFPPSTTIVHPSIGSVVAHELGSNPKLEIPPFFTVDTNSYGGGFLGAAWNPFFIRSNGTVLNLGGNELNKNRLKMLSLIEDGFANSKRGDMPSDHKKILDKTFKLNTSPQMDALKINKESPQILEAYGNTGLGRGALIARRLIQQGVPFVEIGFGGWDMHQMTHDALKAKLPELDKVLNSLILDLKRLELWDNVAIICMGEFGRTPRINQDSGRDHWATSWSSFVSGGLFKCGQAIGATSPDGKAIEGTPYSAGDLMATVLTAMGIDTNRNHTSKRGRPIKVANGGTVIRELLQ